VWDGFPDSSEIRGQWLLGRRNLVRKVPQDDLNRISQASIGSSWLRTHQNRFSS
jgi:hypothetical protein